MWLIVLHMCAAAPQTDPWLAQFQVMECKWEVTHAGYPTEEQCKEALKLIDTSKNIIGARCEQY